MSRAGSSPRHLVLLSALLAVLVLGVALATGTTGISLAAGGGPATSGKADFSISVSPSTQSVQRGKSVSYTVTLNALNGFTGKVSLSVSSLPTSSTGTLVPTTVDFSKGSKQTSILTVATTKDTPLGSSAITVRGTSGKLVRDAQATLIVEKVPGSLAISADPATSTVPPGTAALYTLTFTRTGSAVDAPVTLSITGLPSGAASTFSPLQPTGSSATLQVSTTSSTPSGTYRLVVKGTTSSESATAEMTLVVDPNSRRPFLISGNLTDLLSPGVQQPLDLTLTNQSNQAISITNITVTASTADSVCGSDNYFVVQLPNDAYPISLSAGQTATLSGLGKAQPGVGMHNFPYSQDACKGQAVSLTYTGTAQGN